MKLLLDENLWVRLVNALVDIYPGISHVELERLSGVDDGVVWDYAARHGYSIVPKDADFAERSVLQRGPKVVWIRLGNCSTADVERVMRFASLIIRRFIEDDEETCLSLGRG